MIFDRSISNTNQTAHWSRSQATGIARDAKSEESVVNPVCNEPDTSEYGLVAHGVETESVTKSSFRDIALARGSWATYLADRPGPARET